MNNMDGITSPLVALQLLSLCLTLSPMSDMALLSCPVVTHGYFSYFLNFILSYITETHFYYQVFIIYL